MRQYRLAFLGCLLLVLACVPQQPLRAQESPSKSVFQIWVMGRVNQGPYQAQYHAVYGGTAFFISSDGTALTSSHVVYRARVDRVTYRLLAVVKGEFYGATLVCASELPYDPTKQDPQVSVSRDVAEIQLTPPQFPFDQLVISNVPYARVHTGPLPNFPVLSLGADPNVGDPIRVLGFGRINSPQPYAWSAEGTVSDVGVAADGTPVFNVRFTRWTEPGDSGAPVLNARDQAVGIYNWHSRYDKTRGTAISRSALDPACPP